MPKLKILGGKELLKIFAMYGFEKIDQHGSHVKIRRVGPDGKETLTIPKHDEIDRGLLRQIFIQASRYISESDLRKHFFNTK
jgi:predicted RNA binding protein YcfA (HicA-like mRNA interferase family)